MVKFVLIAIFASLSIECCGQTAHDVVKNFLKATALNSDWNKLNSRLATGKVITYSKQSFVEIENSQFNFNILYKKPNYFMRAWENGMFLKIRTYTDKCNWLYYDRDLSVLFFDEVFNKKPTNLPQTDLLDIFNFPMIDTLFDESLFYRVDFEDVTWDRTLSVFFDKTNFLVTKHTYQNKHGSTIYEYHYKDYRIKDGYLEPRIIENYRDGKKISTMITQGIQYNIDVPKKLFEVPIECNPNSTKPVLLKKPLVIPLLDLGSSY